MVFGTAQSGKEVGEFLHYLEFDGNVRVDIIYLHTFVLWKGESEFARDITSQ